MAQTITGADVTTLPLAPKNPLPYWQRLSAARSFDTGLEKLRDAGGAVTRNVLGPNWTMPPSCLSRHRRVPATFSAAPTREGERAVGRPVQQLTQHRVPGHATTARPHRA